MMTGRGILKAPGPKRKKEGDNGAHEPKRVRMGGLTEHRMEDTMEEAPLDEALEAEDLETSAL